MYILKTLKTRDLLKNLYKEIEAMAYKRAHSRPIGRYSKFSPKNCTKSLSVLVFNHFQFISCLTFTYAFIIIFKITRSSDYKTLHFYHFYGKVLGTIFTCSYTSEAGPPTPHNHVGGGQRSQQIYQQVFHRRNCSSGFHWNLFELASPRIVQTADRVEICWQIFQV